MTVGEMREIMRRRVVPEDLVPQNVIGMLIDDEETAAPPELDAFTFLTRLRGLGIGSADFLYLLEGCEAPQRVVEKVRNNPAMNLQGLILTLENSELTADDYKRILYTARQIWERTLTLRLEKSEMVLQGGDEEEDYSEPTFEEVMEELEHSEEQLEQETEPPASPVAADFVDDSSDEETYNAPIENVVEEIREPEETEVSASSAAADLVDDSPAEETYNAPIENVAEEALEPDETEVPAEPIAVSGNTEELFAEGGFDEAEENPDEQEYEPDEEETYSADYAEEYYEMSEDINEEQPVYTEEIEPVSQPYNGDTTVIVQIDREMLKQNLERLAEEEEAERRAEAARAAAEMAQQEARAAYEAARAEEAEQHADEKTEDGDKPDEPPVRTGKQAPFVVSIPNEHHYHKGAIITAAVGAAVVFGASVGVRFIPEPTVKAETPKIAFAEDSTAVFNEIYYAYNNGNGISGGGNAHEGVYDYNNIFGDLLVRSDGFGTFSEGGNVYTVTMEEVEAKLFKDGEITALDSILPPKGTRIVDAFEDEDALITVFTGKAECGFMKISGGTVLYTVTQDGFMTDFDYRDGNISIGSVYTPSFSRTFRITDEDVYLPRLGTEQKPIAPQSVILSGTRGYSYAVSAAYSAADGAVKRSRAAIGDPVSASADGRYIMSGTSVAVDKDGNRTEGGLLISVGEEINAVSTGIIKAAAFFENGCATYENDVINIRDGSYEATAQLVSLAQPVVSMQFEGNLLLVNGEEGTFLTMNCSDLKNPEAVMLKSVDGAVSGDNALIYGTGANSMTVSHYKLENGSASLVNTLAKPMDASLLETLEFGGVNTVIMDGVRFGVAYRYFDGVSVMSGYAVMSDSGEETPTKELFDDRTGFTLAFKHGGNIYAQCGGGIVDILN